MEEIGEGLFTLKKKKINKYLSTQTNKADVKKLLICSRSRLERLSVHFSHSFHTSCIHPCLGLHKLSKNRFFTYKRCRFKRAFSKLFLKKKVMLLSKNVSFEYHTIVSRLIIIFWIFMSGIRLLYSYNHQNYRGHYRDYKYQ